MYGKILISHFFAPNGWASTKSQINSNGFDRHKVNAMFAAFDSRCGFSTFSGKGGTLVVIPYWFPLFVFAALATLPWTPVQFSLRTLLIAATVFAVGLGLLVMMVNGI
jgi:hypothetical protein